MTNEPIPEHGTNESSTEGSLSSEFIALGRNLIDILRTAWDRPERRKLQDEIADGLTDLGNTLRKDARAVADNPVSQRLKSDIEDFNERIRSGQLDNKIREELISALRTVNIELQKVNAHLSAASTDESTVVDAGVVSTNTQTEPTVESTPESTIDTHPQTTASPEDVHPET